MGRKPAVICVSAGSVFRHPDFFTSKLRGYEQKRHTRPVRPGERAHGHRRKALVARADKLKLFARLDSWIRRRIRMCYWKQWRRPKRRRQMPIRLGIPQRQAIRPARSRKSYWHMAKTIASGVGLTNAWLEQQGLLSIKTLWSQLAPLRRTALVSIRRADPHVGFEGRAARDDGPYPIIHSSSAFDSGAAR